MNQAAAKLSPMILAVAPNGARKTKQDHPALPIAPTELARTAAACAEAGAAMIHLHVRDAEGAHTLDCDAYRAAINAITRAVGKRLVIQATSEAVGRYKPEQQMAMVRDLKPEAVSLAIREIIPGPESELAAGKFFTWLRGEAILPQFILYSADDLRRFDQLVDRGIIPGARHTLLFVLGRYSKGQVSQPSDLLSFIAANSRGHRWSVCAFGALETACAVTAAGLEGDARVGFENNFALPDGSLAPDNAALVEAVAQGVTAIGRPLADADQARELMAP